jgi:hypothetical protein
MKPYVPPDCCPHVEPAGQSALVVHVERAPAGQLAAHSLTFVVLGVSALGR